MTEFFLNYGLFLAKIITVVLAIIAIVSIAAALGGQAKREAKKGAIEINKLNDDLDHMQDSIRSMVVNPEDLKQEAKLKKKKKKEEKKKDKKAAKIASKQRGDGKTMLAEPRKKRSFVVDFDGDIRASAVSNLRNEITTILSMAEPDDEVVVKLESGGGMVTSYGLAASQLDRIKKEKIPLTVCIDKVAASGGYMMACVADKIVAAPFAVVGSIGVVAQIPNFHRLLKKHNIDFEMLTAGEFKRTLTIFGENTNKGREKFVEELETIHGQFKGYVEERRPNIEISTVATGETWSGQRAVDVGLVDELMTSDEYLISLCTDTDVYEVKFEIKKSIMAKFGMSTQMGIESAISNSLDKLMKKRYFS